MRSLLVPLLVLAASCKGFTADPYDPNAAPDAGPDVAASTDPCPNGALHFDGSSFVEVAPNTSFNELSNMTVEAWIQPDTAIGVTEVDVISHHDEKNSDGWVLFLNGGVTFRIYSGPGAGASVEASDADITLGEWHHVAAVFDGGVRSITIFIDGKTKGRQLRDKPMADRYDGTIAIGAAASGSRKGFLGLIDEVRVSSNVRYTTTFTPAYPFPDAEEGTVGTWHFLDGKSSAEVANEATGKLTSKLASFVTPPSFPKPELSTCALGPRH